MNMSASIGKTPRPSRHRGSILIYVLWILVVISVLAFQLTAVSRETTLSQSAFASQLKKQMQIDSAIQFGIFKIISNEWKHRNYELKLNGQTIGVSIFNEAGFVSIYESGDKSLNKIFDFAGVDETTANELEAAIVEDKKPLRLNSFYELRQFSEIDDVVLKRLIPLVSVYHESPVNPDYSPLEVLMRLSRVDQFRVQKLMESVDEVEKHELRKEILESLFNQDTEFTDEASLYYRVYIELEGFLHRVFLKYDRQRKQYIVVFTDSSELEMELVDF